MRDPDLIWDSTTPSAGVANYDIPWISVEALSSTSVKITTGAPTSTPLSYGGAMAGSGSFNDPDQVINSNSSPITVTGLTPGMIYTIRLRAYSGANQTGTIGSYVYDTITMPKTSSVGSVTNTAKTDATPTVNTTTLEGILAASGLTYSDLGLTNTTDSTSAVDDGVTPTIPVQLGSSVAIDGNKSVQRSLLCINSKNNDLNKYSLVYKDTGITVSSGSSASYYTFGTGMFFQSDLSNTKAAGGIGFFTDTKGMKGYVVQLESTSNVNTNHKELRIFKVVNGKKIALDDQTPSTAKTLNAVYGATMYKIDIRVKVQSSVVVIDAYVNGYRITVVDTDTSGATDPTKLALDPTSGIFLFCNMGSAFFDYVYATQITEQEYNSGLLSNAYGGQFGKATLNFLYGERTISNFNKMNIPGGYLEEFGTVARELRKTTVKYPSRPGFPLYPSLGIQQYVQVLGTKLTSFGAEMYIVNNAGTFMPLNDSDAFSFQVIGNYVASPGDQEYTETLSNQFSTVDPVVFDSVWIQNETDAKNLATWIKNQWSKKQSIVNLEVFGNPLLVPGDIISINYPSNGLSGTEKFIVTNVNNTYGGGLSTTFTARSIYS